MNWPDHRLEFLVGLLLDRPNSLPFSNHGKSDRAGQSGERDEGEQILQAELEPASFAVWLSFGRLGFHRYLNLDRGQPEQDGWEDSGESGDCFSEAATCGQFAGFFDPSVIVGFVWWGGARFANPLEKECEYGGHDCPRQQCS